MRNADREYERLGKDRHEEPDCRGRLDRAEELEPNIIEREGVNRGAPHGVDGVKVEHTDGRCSDPEERRANDDVHNPGYLRVPRRRDLVVSDGKHREVVEEGEEDDEHGIDGAGGDEDQDAQREDDVNRTG